MSDAAKLVKLADKICNLRDMSDHPPAKWDLARRREYFEWAKAVIDNLRGVHPGSRRSSTPRTRGGREGCGGATLSACSEEVCR